MKNTAIKNILNIKTGIIHDANKPCEACKRMKKENAKYFEKCSDAVNYYEGNKKAEYCGVCFKYGK